MELLEIIVKLLVGLVVFVTGMSMMSTGLKQSAGRSIRKLFKKIKNNKIASVGIGAGTTAIIQSSGATTVMVVGFLTAGALSFSQGFNLMLGAFLGTTVTGLLVSFSSFSFSVFLMALAFVGFILGFINKATVKSISEILIGFGILFFGLEAMKEAFAAPQIQSFLVNMLSSVDFPILLMFLGIVLTAITQSSSATNGIVIIMVLASPELLSTGLYLILGSSVGALMPTVLAAFKSNVLAKRVTFSHLILRTLMGLLITIILWILATPVSNLLAKFDPANAGLVLAIFSIIYNMLYIIVMLPLTNQVEKLANVIFKDREKEKQKASLLYINDNLLTTPPVAIIQVKNEIAHMFNLARENHKLSMHMLFSLDLSKVKELEAREENIDFINNEISAYLIKLSTKASLYDEVKIGTYYHVINDIERIGDHAYNFCQMAKQLTQEELSFSSQAKDDFERYNEVLDKMFDLSLLTFMDRRKEDLQELHSHEEQIKFYTNLLSRAHFERIKSGECQNEMTPFHQQLLTELERVADHLINIGYSIVSPTGDEVKHAMTDI